MDGGGDDLAMGNGGDHHPKQRQAGGEIGRPIDRIDDKRQIGAGQILQQGGIVAGGFLPDHNTAGKFAPQPRGDDHLRGFVGLRDQIERAGLHSHRAIRQIAESRQDFLAGGIPHQGCDGRELGGRKSHGLRSNRVRSARCRRTFTCTAVSSSCRSTTSPCWYNHARLAPSSGRMS